MLAGRIENVAVAGVDVVAAACGTLMEGMASAEASLAATKSEAQVQPAHSFPRSEFSNPMNSEWLRDGSSRLRP